jgi:hypothetical protein
MKNLFIKGKVIPFVLTIGAAFFTLLLFSGCSTSGDEVQSFKRGGNSEADKVLTFYETSNRDKIKWKVHFKDDEISEVYKDGKRLSRNEIDNYRDLINDKVSGLGRSSKDRNKKYRVYSLNENLSKDMKKLGEDLKKQKFKIKANIDKDLKKEMKELSIELKKLKDNDIKLWFDKNNFKNEWDFNFEFDTEKFNEEMEKLSENLKNMEIKIDMPDIKINLEGLEENLKDLDIKLKDLDKDLEGINSFFKDLKSELVKDKLIESEDDNVKINFKEGEMYINDKIVSEDLFQKYKAMYKKHTGKELKEKHYFHLN